MRGGDTLMVRRGIYAGPDNFIAAVPDGTPDAWTTIQAEQPMESYVVHRGKALHYRQYLLALKGQYVKIDGFVFDLADSLYPPHNGLVSGHHNKVVRSIFRREGLQDNYGGLLLVTGSNNLFEDIAGVGVCRYCFEQGGPNAITKYNIWRRVVVRMDYSGSPQPKRAITTYGNDNGDGVSDHLYQNVIAIDGNDVDTGRHGEPKYSGIGVGKAAARVRFQGAIVLNEAATYAGIFASVSGDTNSVVDSTVWDLRGGPEAAGIRSDSAGTQVSRVTIGGSSLKWQNAVKFKEHRPSASRTGGTKPANLLNNQPGAIILKRYGRDGTSWGEAGYDVLTSENLWPWPYEKQIQALFRLPNPVPAGYLPAKNDTVRGFAATSKGLYGGPVTLTSYIWEYLGSPCPESICSLQPR